MSKASIKIYRMTHIDNIPHILQYGITHKHSNNANPNFINIGDLSLIDTRENKSVLVDNGEFQNNDVKSIVLGNYIPFYFGIKMPMLYIMQIGGNFTEQATKPNDVIYLACSADRIIELKIDFYFSDGHATNNYTSFYDKCQFEKVNEIIDWKSVKSSYWGGEDNLNIKRKKQAEFLVSSDLPSDVIIGFGCYDDTSKQKLVEYGIEERKIKVITNGYF